jgi:hypothetical protein
MSEPRCVFGCPRTDRHWHLGPAAPRAATEPSERRIVECPHCHEQLSVAGDKAEAPLHE